MRGGPARLSGAAGERGPRGLHSPTAHSAPPAPHDSAPMGAAHPGVTESPQQPPAPLRQSRDSVVAFPQFYSKNKFEEGYKLWGVGGREQGCTGGAVPTPHPYLLLSLML